MYSLYSHILLMHSTHPIYSSNLPYTLCYIIYNLWTQEVRTRLEHVNQQACCDCGMNVGFKECHVFLAETKKTHELMIDCGRSEGTGHGLAACLKEESEPLARSRSQ
jgi:hypothetical protein